MPWTAQTVAATARLEGEEFILSMVYLPTSPVPTSPSVPGPVNDSMNGSFL